MPISIVEHFSPNLKRVKVEIPWTISDEERERASQEFPFNVYNLPRTPLEPFAAIIPHFVNLTELEIMRIEPKHIWYFYDSGALNLEHTRARRVEMKTLKSLIMESRFFDFLYTHIIDFKPSDKIEKLTFFGPAKEPDREAVMRTFIAQQKNLKELSLDVQSEFFDEPLIVQSKLKKFEFLNWVKFYEIERQARFLNFIEPQDELEVLELEASVFGSMNANMQERLKTFRLKSLDLNLKTMKMEFNSHSVEDNELSKLTASFDVLASKEKPNLAVQNLDVLLFGAHQDQIPNFFSLISSKFPNVTSINLGSGSGDYNGAACWNFPPMENLSNLEQLKLIKYHQLDSINIANLKTFSYDFCPTETVKVKFDRFLSRHAAIENLNISFIFILDNLEETKRCCNDLIALFDSAIRNLNELKMISVRGRKITDVSDEKFDWNDIQMTTIAALIEEKAKPGFKFCSVGFELLKRDDKKVVRKVEGSWEAFM